MNRCVFSKKISSYFDNQLSDEEKARLDVHLSTCVSCRQELEKLKGLSEQLHTWRLPELGSDFESALHKKIALQEMERSPSIMKKKTLIYLIPSGVLAAVLLFLFIGVFSPKMQLSRYIESDISVPGRGSSRESLLEKKKFHIEGGDKLFVYADRCMVDSKSTSVGGTWLRDNSEGKPESAKEAEIGFAFPSSAGEGSVIVIQPYIPATAEGEKVIRTAEIKLEVEDGNQTYQRAAQLCQQLKGYLSSSQFYRDNEGRQNGTIVMRIPRDNFLAALDKLGTLGVIRHMSSDSQDVSVEYANLKARLDAAMVVYNKMLEALNKRQVTIPDAVRLESELTPVRQRIEELKNQIESLNNAVSFTTITLNFYESEVSAKVLKESKHLIQENLITAQINSVRILAAAIRMLPGLFGIIVVCGISVWGVVLVKNLVVNLFKKKS